ncbi:MAG: hypothetical protein K9H16_06040 [Bacteroidales bacterium]|nr:hypothetical protein [Bacteroidales bacterium]
MLPFSNLTLAAKIRWRMKYDRNPLLTLMQDKLAVKKYAAQRGVPSAEVLFVCENPESIPFGDLPEKCFIKANHGRNWNILKNGESYVDFKGGQKFISTGGFYDLAGKTRECLDPQKIVEMCTKWLNTIFCTTEWAYINIPPAIFVETLIEPEPGKETLDYRLYTFRGKVAAISIGSPSMRLKKENIFFDTSWKKFALKNNFEKEPETIPEKPAFLEKMLEAAGKLGKDIDFVRIDFFADSQQFYLSEMTIYPNGGQDNRPTSDDGFNRYLGRYWKMSIWQWMQARGLELEHMRKK